MKEQPSFTDKYMRNGTHHSFFFTLYFHLANSLTTADANYNITVLKFKKGQTPDPGDSNELFNITVDRVGQNMVGFMSFKDSKCTWTDTCPAPPNATNSVINLNTPSVGGTISSATFLPNAFNSINSPLRFILSSPSGVDTTAFDEVSELLINAVPVDPGRINIDQNGRGITVQQDLSSGLNTIYLKAYDDAGRPLYFEEFIWAGNMDFTVEVLDRQTGLSVTEPVDIKIFLAEAQHVSSVATSTSGSATFSNIPDRTIIVEATSESGLNGSSGGVPSSGVITVYLGGAFPISSEKNLDFEAGLSGWENEGDAGAAAVVPHVETRRKLGTGSGNNDLELRTIGEGEQYVHHQFMPAQGVTNVKLRYRFQTDEIPGGFFGSEYNDYFSVRISGAVDHVGESNSMNGLGLPAFLPGGFTEWREANLAISGGDSVIQVDAVVANVADGEFDAKVVIDFIEEVSNEVKPFHLAWDSGNGGILVDYEVLGQGPLAVATNIQLYWSTGERLADVIGEPFGSVNVPAGTNPGWHGGSNVQVTTLAPDSVTHVVAVSGSAIKALPDVVVRGGRNANLNVVTPLMFSIIKGGLRAAGQSIAEISSTARTPEDQARAMFNNLVETGVATQLNIYRDPGDAVIRVYERLTAGLPKSQIIAMSASIQSQMAVEINNQGPSNVSRHCGDPAKLCVVDVGAALLPDNSRFIGFVGQLIKTFPGGNFIDERGTNGCYHLELGSEGASAKPTVFPECLARDSRQGICINKNECLSMTGKEPVPNPFNDPTPNCYRYVADVQCCVDRVAPPEEPPCAQAEEPFGGVFLDYMKLAEGYVGAYPYASLEGGNPTVGYGHKLTDDEVDSGAFNGGLTKEAAEALLIQDIQLRVPQAIQVYNNAQGQGAFDSAPLWGKRMLVDKVFQTGAGGLAQFVKMMKAIADEDKDTAVKEMLTSYINTSGVRVWDYGRRTKFVNNVLDDCQT